LDPEVRVSVVIPTRGGEGLVWGERRTFVVDAVRSVLEKGGHRNLEIVVVHDDVTPWEVLDELLGLGAPDLQLVRYSKPFNFSEKCNLGVVSSYGDIVVLLNDDVEIVSDNFLVELCAPLSEEGVGMTGARLLFADTTVQHAGLTFDRKDLLHVFAGRLRDDPGPFGALLLNREVSGLTGACVALRRSVYDEIGGLCELLPVNFNDVDLSLKVRHQGYRLLWMATAEAFHFESQTRSPVVHNWERDVVLQRWVMPEQDPYLPYAQPAVTASTVVGRRKAKRARKRIFGRG
ncbi:MAG TPA: glycosyltransferase, partial [Nocardioides sp.]|nr:glycosyltransferase [Nocardioides sp.]